MKNNTQFLTPSDLAARWKMHQESVRRLLRKRALTSIVIGRQRRVPLEAVIEFERQATIAPLSAHQKHTS